MSNSPLDIGPGLKVFKLKVLSAGQDLRERVWCIVPLRGMGVLFTAEVPTFSCYILPLYIAIIVGPSAAALSGAQNSDFPQPKSALNRY